MTVCNFLGCINQVYKLVLIIHLDVNILKYTAIETYIVKYTIKIRKSDVYN